MRVGVLVTSLREGQGCNDLSTCLVINRLYRTLTLTLTLFLTLPLTLTLNIRVRYPLVTAPPSCIVPDALITKLVG